MNDETIYADDVNYWKTSQVSADKWVEKAKREITTVGGFIINEGFMFDGRINHSMFVLTFQVGDEVYRIAWPVLPTRKGEMEAAKRQAATMLYHDVKAKCMVAKVFGIRTAFIGYLMLPTGQTVGESATPELVENVRLLLPGSH